ncbi:uncharacterized protein ACA1_250830, partial [Acanthamoeba castellanii str. Neff]
QALARRLPLPNLALDDSGIGPNGQSVGDDCGQENESEEGEEESEDMRIEEEEFKMLLEEGKTYVERPVPPHPRHGLLDMLDAVWVRITARLRQHKIEQEEYWGEYRGFRHPPASELVEIVSSRRNNVIVCLLEFTVKHPLNGQEERYIFNVKEEVKMRYRSPGMGAEADQTWFLEMFCYPPNVTKAKLVLSNLYRTVCGNSLTPKRRHIDCELLLGLSSALGLGTYDVLRVVRLIALSAGCHESLSKLQLNSEDDDDDKWTEANSSPDMCTMVPPFDMAYPEVDTLFAPGRHTPVDLLRELKLFVRRWRLLLELPRAYVVCHELDWVELEDVVTLLPFISPEKGVSSFVTWRSGTRRYQGKASVRLRVPDEKGQLRITCRLQQVQQRVKFSIRAAASTAALQRRTDVFYGHFELPSAQPPSKYINDQMAGPGFFDQFARTFNLSLRIPGTDLRVQAAVLLAVCCLSSCTPYNFREKQPFIGHLSQERCELKTRGRGLSFSPSEARHSRLAYGPFHDWLRDVDWLRYGHVPSGC